MDHVPMRHMFLLGLKASYLVKCDPQLQLCKSLDGLMRNDKDLEEGNRELSTCQRYQRRLLSGYTRDSSRPGLHWTRLSLFYSPQLCGQSAQARHLCAPRATFHL